MVRRGFPGIRALGLGFGGVLGLGEFTVWGLGFLGLLGFGVFRVWGFRIQKF